MLTVHNNALEFIRSHPELFFPDGIPDPLVCTQCVVGEIIASGGTDISIRRAAEWWLVTSAIDWFMNLDLSLLFQQFIPLPQLARNASRFEVVVAAYAASVATMCRPNEPVMIVGEAPSEDLWALMPSSHTRALAFRFPAINATSSPMSMG
jgi:hypothetical protein